MADLPERLQEALAGRYQLGRELGRGGMAMVFLVHDLKHNREVALKVLHPELAATLGPQRFQREIRTTARLQHPHILPVLDSGETAGQLWYTMPFVDGESLRDRLRRERQLPIYDALQITREVADALGYAHEQGIVHRDIKPENILLSRGHALVADFGVARALQAAGSEQLTQTGTSVGTPAYMSPEQAMADSALDGRSDLYSLGCVLYEMLTGEAPYTGPSAQAIVAKRLIDPVPSARRLRDTVPHAVDAAVQRVLAKAPADRFPSAVEFARSLSEATYWPPALTQAVVATSSPHGRREFALAGALSVGIVLAGAVWHWSQMSGIRSDAHRSTSERLAVLPFENLGDSANAYFAEGVTDAVRDKLTTMPGLQVIASVSSAAYRHTSKLPTRIGQELGVRYILVGKVRWAKSASGISRIQVRPELIDATTGAQNWGDAFDAPLTDVFQVQNEIAERVVEALGTALSPVTTPVRPTNNIDSYDFLLRGNDYLNQGTQRPYAESSKNYFLLAVQMYDDALAHDSAFALAWAKKSFAHASLYHWRHDHSERRLALANMAAGRALALNPDLPEGHLAMGYYHYWGQFDYGSALKEFLAVLRQQPDNAEVLEAVGRVKRRQGRWEEAAASLRRAADLDPRNSLFASEAGDTYLLMRQYGKAEPLVQRVIDIDPDRANGYDTKAWLCIMRSGDSMAARAVAQEALAKLSMANLLRRSNFTMFALASDSAYKRQIEALTRADFQDDSVAYWSTKFSYYQHLDRPQPLKAYADSLRRFYESEVKLEPTDEDAHAQLGYFYAVLGRAHDAIREGELAIASVPISKDAYLGWNQLINMARIYGQLGQADEAVDIFERGLAVPSYLSISVLRLDHDWDRVRGHPRFQQLLRMEDTPAS